MQWNICPVDEFLRRLLQRDYRNVIQANSVTLYFPIFTVAWKPLLGDGAPVWNLKIVDSYCRLFLPDVEYIVRAFLGVGRISTEVTWK